MVFEPVAVGDPGAGQVRLKQTAVGVNYIDVYHRNGTYPLPAMPNGIGMEAAGVVEAVGADVADFKVGDRVAYSAGPVGSYADARVMAAASLVRLPDSIPDKIGAAIMLQGMTARYLLRQTHPVQAGDWVLVQAAAGGMGLWLCQWAAALGARVIGTVSTDAKAELAAANGCHHPIVYSREDFVARVKEITGGAGVAVVYDGVGKDTFHKSFECLAVRGHMVSYGAASGAPEPFALSVLAPKSASLTRPTLFHYIATRAELLANAGDVFEVIAAGTVKVQAPIEFALKDAAAAHRALEGRSTTGSIILIP